MPEADLDDDELLDSNEHAPDAYVGDARLELQQLFREQPEEVFYLRQLTVRLEKRFFHWVTGRALKALVAEGALRTEKVRVGTSGTEPLSVHFSPKNRYWKRKAKGLAALVARFSAPEFTRGLGDHGELMVDAALPRAGFLPMGSNVRVWMEREWTETGHDLDRVFVRDGVAYGTEIKNTLGYIPRDELEAKINMCAHLNLRPLFIMRSAPKTYIHLINEARGFALIMRYQFYPLAHASFADEISSRLGLPVSCPRAIEAGTINRLLRWHDAHR
jgi:hypothetical protein